jgi:hypothetical protein
MTPLIALTGELPFVVILSGILGLIVSALLLQSYRRAVRRRMGRIAWTSAAITAADITPMPPQPPPVPLRIHYIDATAGAVADGGGLYLGARRAPWRAAVVYCIGGVLFAAVLATAFLRAGGLELLPLRFLFLLWVYAWPLVPTLLLTSTTARRDKVLLVAGYFAGYAVLVLVTVARSTGTSVGQLIASWLEFNLIGSVVFSAFLWRRVRGVGPLVVTFLVFALSGAVFLPDLLSLDPTVLLAVSDVFYSLGLADFAFVILILIGLVVFSALAWPALHLVRRAYARKRVNDLSMIIDALWLFFAVNYGVDLAFEGVLWATAALAAFVVYVATVRLGFRLARREVVRGPNLLVLRVFALGKRSENLFRAVSGRWRHIGAVQLIAGPDLASATVEPHQFLDFVSGRLGRQFIDGPEAFNRRIAELDARPDFDGRFRVTDFFCYQNTWQPTLRALVQRSDAVLMDLRRFSESRLGCIYEIRQLFECVPLTRIVMVVDDTTNINFFEHALTTVWNETPMHSPNRALRHPELRVVRGRQEGWGNRDTLLAAVCNAAVA